MAKYAPLNLTPEEIMDAGRRYWDLRLQPGLSQL